MAIDFEKEAKHFLDHEIDPFKSPEKNFAEWLRGFAAKLLRYTANDGSAWGENNANELYRRADAISPITTRSGK